MGRRHDRRLRLRRLWRRAKLPTLLAVGGLALLVALAGVSPWPPAAMPAATAAQAAAERPVGRAESARATQPSLAAAFAGRVVGVADGDTLTVLTTARAEVRVRRAEIDAPESGQPYGARAKQVLSDLAFGRQVRVATVDIDRYDRVVGRVHAGARDVNTEMVRQGAAWVYVRFNRDPALPPIEAEARAARRGLWALPEAERVPPWEWRAQHRR